MSNKSSSSYTDSFSIDQGFSQEQGTSRDQGTSHDKGHGHGGLKQEHDSYGYDSSQSLSRKETIEKREDQAANEIRKRIKAIEITLSDAKAGDAFDVLHASKASKAAKTLKPDSLLVLNRMEKLESLMNDLLSSRAQTPQIPKSMSVSEEVERLSSEVHRLSHDLRRHEKTIEELRIKNRDLEKTLRDKVDTAVLEELAHHIATKEELRKYIKKSSLSKIISQNPAVLSPPEKDVRDLLEKLNAKQARLSLEVKKLESRFPDNFTPDAKIELLFQSQLFDIESKMERKLQDCILDRIQIQAQQSDDLAEVKMDRMRQNIEIGVKAIITDTIRTAIDEIPDTYHGNEPTIRKVVRDFDEKLYSLCTELSTCKQLFAHQSTQPFYRCAQWSWTSGHLKLGSAVPWNLQTSNTGTALMK